ncbi:MAG: SgcJ/EcaC family oxidoreductase [Bacteroidota bacterium]
MKFENPEDIVKTFVEAWNEKDAHKLASVFVEDAEFVNVTGLWWHSKERIFKAHDYGLKVIFDQSTLELILLKIRFLSLESAIVHAKMRLSNQTTLEEANKPMSRKNILLFVVKKSNEGWTCVACQNTEVLPGKETFLIDKKGEVNAVNYGKFKG